MYNLIYFLIDNLDEGARVNKNFLANSYVYIAWTTRHKISLVVVEFTDNTPQSYYRSFYSTSTLKQVASYDTLVSKDFPAFNGGIGGLTLVWKAYFYDSNNDCHWRGNILAMDSRGLELICFKQNISYKPYLVGHWIIIS